MANGEDWFIFKNTFISAYAHPRIDSASLNDFQWGS